MDSEREQFLAPVTDGHPTDQLLAVEQLHHTVTQNYDNVLHFLVLQM